MVLGGFWARVGLEKKPPKIIRKSIFRVFERLNDSTDIANPSPSHFEMDDASLSDKIDFTWRDVSAFSYIESNDKVTLCERCHTINYDHDQVRRRRRQRATRGGANDSAEGGRGQHRTARCCRCTAVHVPGVAV